MQSKYPESTGADVDAISDAYPPIFLSLADRARPDEADDWHNQSASDFGAGPSG